MRNKHYRGFEYSDLKKLFKGTTIKTEGNKYLQNKAVRCLDEINSLCRNNGFREASFVDGNSLMNSNIESLDSFLGSKIKEVGYLEFYQSIGCYLSQALNNLKLAIANYSIMYGNYSPDPSELDKPINMVSLANELKCKVVILDKITRSKGKVDSRRELVFFRGGEILIECVLHEDNKVTDLVVFHVDRSIMVTINRETFSLGSILDFNDIDIEGVKIKEVVLD